MRAVGDTSAIGTLRLRSLLVRLAVSPSTSYKKMPGAVGKFLERERRKLSVGNLGR